MSSIVLTCPGCAEQVTISHSQVHESANCPVCGTSISRNSGYESSVHLTTSEPQLTRKGPRIPGGHRSHSLRSLFRLYDLSNIQGLALVGCALLLLGVFLPLMSVPVVGNLNYIGNGQGDGIIVLVLVAISALLTLARWHGSFWFTDLGTLALMAFTFTTLQVRLSEARSALKQLSTGNPFAGLEAIALQSVQLQWGWAVLLIGAILLVAGAIAAEVQRRPQRRRFIVMMGAASIPLTLVTVGTLTWGAPSLVAWIAEELDRQEIAERRRLQAAADRRAAEEAAALQAAEEAAVQAALRDAAEKAAREDANRQATNQTVVPLDGSGSKAPADAWPDANQNAVQQGSLRIRVGDLRAKDGHLRIRLLLQHVGNSGGITYRSWATATMHDAPRLTDPTGNSYQHRSIDVQPGSVRSLQPGESATDVLTFDTPPGAVQSLKLELPASAFA